MTVHPIERPAEIQVEGRASRSIELIAIERLQTPAGEFQTQKIRSVLKAELGSANITVTNDSWFAPGIGLVAEEHRELVTVFGLAIRNTRERWGLESAAPGSADVLHRAPKRVKER